MACADYTGIWKQIYDWQTLSAGGIAIIAAGIAYCVGHGQIQAIANQTAALEKQTADLRRAEQQRLARENSTIARVLYASMGLVATDTATANSRFSFQPDSPVLDEQFANSIRDAVGKYSFNYLREKVGNFDREDIMVAFLVLEANIDKLRAEAGPIHAGPLKERLNALLEQAKTLQTHAAGELEKAKALSSA
jgi:hypothetical protein